MRFSSRSIRLVLLAALCAGCGDEAPPHAASAALPAFGEAVIRGTVRYVGNPPERKMIDTAGRCFEGATAIQEETVVVGPAGGLRDVIVYLKDAPPSDGSAQRPLTMDQVGCRYVPHVVSLQVGQPLQIATSDPDPAFHNVHWLSERNGRVNLGFPPGSPSQMVKFRQPEFIRLRCDVHPWMEAWVGVFDHPFSATTDANGTFTLPRVPAGKYTLATWHPILGERTQPVEIGKDGSLNVSFEYAPPTRGP